MNANRKQRVDNTFGFSEETQQKQNDFMDKIRALEKLMIQENRVWWDSITLQKYVDRNMIPRGLRMKKVPTTIYSDTFKEEWNLILSTCSLKLIQLIIKQEEEKLKVLSEEIKTAESAVQEFKDSKDFDQEYQKIKDNVDKHEEWLASVKKTKFQRDIYDYSHNQVYEWKPRDRTFNTPKSIIKKRKNSKRRWERSRNVSFSSTSADPSEGPSETSGDSDAGVRRTNPPIQPKNTRKTRSHEPAKNDLRDDANEEEESMEEEVPRRHTRRNKP